MRPAKFESTAASRHTSQKSLHQVEVFNLDDPTLLAWGQIVFDIEGTKPLMQANMDSKTAIMLAGHMGTQAKTKHPPKNPQKDMLAALHVIGPRPKTTKLADLKRTRYGMPVMAFKQMLVRAAYICGSSMQDAKCAVIVHPTHEGSYLVEIRPNGVPSIDIRPVRNDNGSADIRCRPIFAPGWKARIVVEYNSMVLKPRDVISWMMNGGKSVGIGELRQFGKKSSGGECGEFRVTRAEVQTPILPTAKPTDQEAIAHGEPQAEEAA